MDGHARAAEELVPVRVSWERAYDACPPAAADLLRAMAVLNLTAVSSPAVGAAVDLSPDQTAAALADLTRDGWAVPRAQRHTLVERARTWLAANAAGLADPARADEISRRFADYHAAAVNRGDAAEAGEWLDRHRAEVLSAVRACDRDGLRRHGTRLAYAAWPAAGRVPDPDWWQELAGAGEALAIADRDPGMLADLLHRSAIAFAGRGDRMRAEEQWVRALAIIRRPLRDPAGAERVPPHERDRGVAVLTGLGALYRDWNRLGKALDAYLSLIDLQRDAGNALGTAEAQARVAATMHAAGRLSSAAGYFAQADESMSALTNPGAPPDLVTTHARILVWHGRALWDQGQHVAAKRSWSRALAMLIDVDDAMADHVRALLATDPAEPLPDSDPIAGS